MHRLERPFVAGAGLPSKLKSNRWNGGATLTPAAQISCLRHREWLQSLHSEHTPEKPRPPLVGILHPVASDWFREANFSRAPHFQRQLSSGELERSDFCLVPIADMAVAPMLPLGKPPTFLMGYLHSGRQTLHPVRL